MQSFTVMKEEKDCIRWSEIDSRPAVWPGFTERF